MGARPCKYGAICGRSDCLFQHPAQWNPEKVVNSGRIRNCKLGRNCTFRGCFYTHPEGREIDATAEKTDDAGAKNSKDQLESKTFKLRKQSTTELERQAAAAAEKQKKESESTE